MKKRHKREIDTFHAFVYKQNAFGIGGAFSFFEFGEMKFLVKL